MLFVGIDFSYKLSFIAYTYSYLSFFMMTPLKIRVQIIHVNLSRFVRLNLKGIQNF